MREKKPSSRLDPKHPLVLDTRELGRRPGSMREVRRQAESGTAFGLDLVRVPAMASVELDLRLESVMEGVLVTGTATAPLTGECARCLEPFTDTLTVDLQELFAYADTTTDQTTDEEVARMDGDLIDLEPTLRDAVVLALPLTPVCTPDCGGLCVDCGERLDDLPEDHSHAVVDPRWAGLSTLLDKDVPADADARARTNPRFESDTRTKES